MLISIISLFPEAFSYFDCSIIKRAKEKRIIEINFLNPRDFTTDKHKKVDDTSYGGGPGMVMKFEPIYWALQAAKKRRKTTKSKVILTHPAGQLLTQKLAYQLSAQKHIIIICGHYEGVDARIEKFVDMKISIGRYILTGGELPAMVIVDSVVRHLPGALHHPLSLEERRANFNFYDLLISRKKLNLNLKKIENFSLYSYPVYTKPEVIKVGNKILKVPKVLLSGNHHLITEWRKKHSKKII
ncbi:MAG: tRNA (guanosine(37)-N1)-methyltransferase TrmD [Patescibacteria group bacterium]|nr:tRNA (guanosine(37)-N1)-methyltransferase TrmD [Patescibacteria group bacterium]